MIGFVIYDANASEPVRQGDVDYMSILYEA